MSNQATSTQSAQAPKRQISPSRWQKKLNEVEVSKDDLNRLVMNYLVIEGYKDAAEKFSVESGLKPNIDLDSIQDRMNIRNAIQSGNIEEAIERVNDLNPEILDTNPQLYFHLQQQRLIEYIRQGKIEQALEFAQEELAPRGEENPEFLGELERTMALLAFDNSPESIAMLQATSNPVADLLHPSQRQRTASQVNAAILTSQSQDKDPKLPSLLKMLIWSQAQLEEKEMFPKMTDLATAKLDTSVWGDTQLSTTTAVIAVETAQDGQTMEVDPH